MKLPHIFALRRRLFQIVLATLLCTFPFHLFSQSSENNDPEIFTRPGVIITIFLLFIPILAAVVLVILKTDWVVRSMKNLRAQNEADRFAKFLKNLNSDQIAELQKRKKTWITISPIWNCRGQCHPQIKGDCCLTLMKN